jgi:hypothetical protein
VGDARNTTAAGEQQGPAHGRRPTSRT